jgi:hypothetical protein
MTVMREAEAAESVKRTPIAADHPRLSRFRRRRRRGQPDIDRRWAISGVIIAVVVLVMAANNLEAIYNSQKDFVVGVGLSAAAFCFGRMWNRRQRDDALKLIRTANDDEVMKAIRDRVGNEYGATKFTALLHRNITAATERLTEYYDEQTQDPVFGDRASLLYVVLGDLEKANENILYLADALDVGIRGFEVPERLQVELVTLRRHVREACNRREELHRQLSDELGQVARSGRDLRGHERRLWKARRLLDRLSSDRVNEDPDECLTVAEAYIKAAGKRAVMFADRLEEIRQLGSAVEDDRSRMPTVLTVLVEDINAPRSQSRKPVRRQTSRRRNRPTSRSNSRPPRERLRLRMGASRSPGHRLLT